MAAAGKQTLTSAAAAVGGQYDPYTNVTQPYAAGGSGATSSAVQKSKSYSNFDSVRRDFSFGQVESFFFAFDYKTAAICPVKITLLHVH